MTRETEKVWAKELGCQAAIKFHSTACSDIRVNKVYVLLLLALGFCFLIAQTYPLIQVLETSKIWCTGSSGSSSLQATAVAGAATTASDNTNPNPLSVSFLHERINSSTIDLSHGEVRVFKPHGMAAHLFIEMGTYRGSPRSFSIVGLASKPIDIFHHPPYACEWISRGGGGGGGGGSSEAAAPVVVKGEVHKILPDWNYGRLYTVVVLTCKFKEDVGTDKSGGDLVLYASYGDKYREPERIVVFTEVKDEYNATLFNPPFPYDYVYCGSSIYGDVSPQRMREWMAYHANFFGNRSHFFFHDSGGFHDDVRRVLEPWIKQGRVTIQNIQQQEIYDGYYHNQFLVVNDCLFRSRFLANWTFFFDVDEYMYVNPATTLSAVLAQDKNVTQITVEQVPISNEICIRDNSTNDYSRKWIFEKLVYRKVLKRGIRYDRKYAVQARHVEATGVHMSMNMLKGKNLYVKGDQIRYYHYHGTLDKRSEVCEHFVDPRNKTEVVTVQHENHRIDETMFEIVAPTKQYEIETIGNLPTII
ncbi:unnamed protein product [Sphagnum jensenii]|uniref:Glycosyltransferase family 92 protein n=1 Tax=Sphagnum jensenii TaxID=128206 RepID=A0ABP1C3D5_9BRYO